MEKITDITLNEPIEVTKEQYEKLIVSCAGGIAHRIYDGKYYIMLWIAGYKQIILKELNKEEENVLDS